MKERNRCQYEALSSTEDQGREEASAEAECQGQRQLRKGDFTAPSLGFTSREKVGDNKDFSEDQTSSRLHWLEKVPATD